MGKYLVVVREYYVNACIADNEYINDFENDSIKPGSYDWGDIEGEITLGIYEGESEELACESAAEEFEIDVRGLLAYKLN